MLKMYCTFPICCFSFTLNLFKLSISNSMQFIMNATVIYFCFILFFTNVLNMDTFRIDSVMFGTKICVVKYRFISLALFLLGV